MPELILYYDGECPICREYSLFLKIKKDHKLILKNARESIELKEICEKNKIDISKGIILITHKKEILQGKIALLYLKSLDTNQNWLYKIFFSKSMIGVVYPILLGMRFLLLKILGKKTKIY